MVEVNQIVAAWWPIVLFIGGGIVWALRLEGRVNLLQQILKDQARRLDEALSRIEKSNLSVEQKVDSLCERMAAVETAIRQPDRRKEVT